MEFNEWFYMMVIHTLLFSSGRDFLRSLAREFWSPLQTIHRLIDIWNGHTR